MSDSERGGRAPPLVVGGIATVLAVLVVATHGAWTSTTTGLLLSLGWWLALALIAVAVWQWPRPASAGWPVLLAGFPAIAAVVVGHGLLLAALTSLPAAGWLREPSLPALMGLALALVAVVLVPLRLWPLLALPAAPATVGAAGDGIWQADGRFSGIASSVYAWTRGRDPFRDHGASILFLHGVLLALPATLVLRPELWRWALVVVPPALALAGLFYGRVQRHVATLSAVPRMVPPTGSAATSVAAPSPSVPGSALQRAVALRAALRGGDVDQALAILEAGVEVTTPAWPDEDDQREALIIAATLNDSRPLRTMIAAGADVNHASQGLTPLLAATRDSYYGRPEIVLSLLANGARLDVRDENGCTPLHHAVLSVDPAVAVMLLDAGADVDAVDAEGYTPLARAAAAGNPALLPVLLQRKPSLTPAGTLPVLCAAAGATDDDPECVRLLLRAKARTDVADGNGRGPLHHAVAAGHLRIVQSLLDAGAAVDVRDTAGRTPLHLACSAFEPDGPLARTLLAAGADIELADDDGVTPMMLRRARGIAAPGSSGQAEADDGIALLRDGRHAAVRVWLRHAAPEQRAGLALEAARQGSLRVLAESLASPLSADACLPDGERLLDAAVAQWPVTRALVAALPGSGVSIAGAGILARLLRSFAPSDADAEVLALRWLDAGADPFGDHDGATALHHAVALGFERLAGALLERGVDPGCRDRAGVTPMHLALRHDDGPALRLLVRLLRHGADPDAAGSSGETPLALALDGDRTALVDWLRWSTWRPPRRRLDGRDLVAAASVGDAAAVSRLLELGLAVDTRDSQGSTGLLRAAGNGHAEVVELLLARGARIDASARSGTTPLAAAVIGRRPALVQLLIDRGAAVDRRLANQATALLVAAACGHGDELQRLLAAGADVAASDAAGNTALHAVAAHAFGSDDGDGVRQLFRLLLSAGADIDSRNKEGLLALHVACGAAATTTSNPIGIDAALDILLARASMVVMLDEQGRSPLHYAAAHGQLTAVRRLIARGADVSQADQGGWRPEHYAAHYGYTDVVQELRESVRPPGLPLRPA